MITATRESLLDAMRGARNERAWTEFSTAYSPMLGLFCRKLGVPDADIPDLVQNTLMVVDKTFRDLTEPFDRSKGSFKSWLRGIAKNKCLDHLRMIARRNRREEEYRSVRRDIEVPPGIDELFEREWELGVVLRAFELASREVRPVVHQAFQLYAVEGRRPAQVARFLGVSENAVYISKHRVVKRIRQLCKELREQEG